MVWIWLGFVSLVLLLLLADLLIVHRRPQEIPVRRALIESAVWVCISLLFAGFIEFAYGRHLGGLGGGDHHSGRHYAVLYVTGYFIEQSLSIDNLLVIAALFKFFAIPPRHQYRVLFWGVFGAQVMRGMLIGFGTALISRFGWMLFIFAAFLLYAAYRIAFTHGKADAARSPILRVLHRILPVSPVMQGAHFFVRGETREGSATRWLLTPLALALIMVEVSDLLFAVDSIPAIFAITTDPFLVFTSNIFAVLGLRAMYFALAGVIRRLRFLTVSLAVLLALIGVKMLARPWLEGRLHHENVWMLGVAVVVVGTGTLASLFATGRGGVGVSE